MREVKSMEDEVSNKLLRVLASPRVFKPAPELLQLVAGDTPTLRAGVAQVFGVQAYESTRATIWSLLNARWEVKEVSR